MTRDTVRILLGILGVLYTLPAAAQSLNIDFGDMGGTPASSYGAAANQPGTWNAVTVDPMGGTLVDLGGAPSAAGLSAPNLFWGLYFDNVSTTGEDEKLIDDFNAGDGPLTFTGLTPGEYEIFTYALAPDSGSFITDVAVLGSPDPLQPVGGNWPGAHVLGTTYALHRFTVDSSGRLDVQISGSPITNSLNGMQLVQLSGGFASYCVAKVNSLGCTPTIAASGGPSATASSGFVVECAMVRNQRPGLLFYKVGGAQAALAFQCGTLCVGPQNVSRTPARSSGGNTPPANDCSGVFQLDMNAFAQGLAGGSPVPALRAPGSLVHCQWWGRDQGFASPCNTTLSDGGEYTIGS